MGANVVDVAPEVATKAARTTEGKGGTLSQGPWAKMCVGMPLERSVQACLSRYFLALQLGYLRWSIAYWRQIAV